MVGFEKEAVAGAELVADILRQETEIGGMYGIHGAFIHIQGSHQLITRQEEYPLIARAPELR